MKLSGGGFGGVIFVTDELKFAARLGEFVVRPRISVANCLRKLKNRRLVLLTFVDQLFWS
jgi:hypothetical protein